MASISLLALMVASFVVMVGFPQIGFRLALLAGGLLLCSAFIDTSTVGLSGAWTAFWGDIRAPMGALGLVLLGYCVTVMALLTRWWTKSSQARRPEDTEQERIRRRGRMQAPLPPPPHGWLQ